jgi:hypothetical protein
MSKTLRECLLGESKKSPQQEVVEEAYGQMFEDATFGLDTILDHKLLPAKYKPKIKAMLKELRQMEFDIIKDIGEINGYK